MIAAIRAKPQRRDSSETHPRAGHIEREHGRVGHIERGELAGHVEACKCIAGFANPLAHALALGSQHKDRLLAQFGLFQTAGPALSRATQRNPSSRISAMKRAMFFTRT